MSKIVFMFPGQGSQSIGMGVALAEKYPEAQRLFDEAQRLLGFDLLDICRRGPEEKLRETDIAQPALYVTGFVAAFIAKSLGLRPDAVAGHSVGEYVALAVAGVFSYEDGLTLVLDRGRLMSEAGRKHPGSMAAILGLSAEAIAAVCERAIKTGGVCQGVNFNTPEQIVVAGDRAALEKFVPLAREAGARRVILLNVAGAFHSGLMRDAASEMEKRLDDFQFRDAVCPIAMNLDGELRSNSLEIKAALARQLDSPVQWMATIENLKAAGASRFVECGAGQVLCGLLKRIDKTLSTFSTESLEAIDQLAKALGISRREA